MKYEKKKVNFEDARGRIMDIFENAPKEHCVILTTKKGGVRGNHYHNNSLQYDFIISGKMKIFGQKVGSKKIETKIVGADSWLEWDKNEAHEFVAIEDTTFITFVNGPRGGEKFETDTIRLKTPLHEAKGEKIEDILKEA